MLNRLRRPRDDQGFSLIELTVVMLMIGVLGAVVSTAIITSMRTTRQDYNRQQSSAQLQTAIERITRDLRVADPLDLANTQDVVLDTMRGGVCVRVEYKVTGTTLTWQHWTFGATCAAYPSTTGSTTAAAVPLVTNINPASSGSSGTYFTFFADQGEVASPTSPTGYTRAQVIVTANQPENRTAITLQSSTELRNHT